MTLSLYRKYRPQTFSEVEGQEHIIRVLEGALKENALAHAYLFAGSRGTGKTTVARILARALGTSDVDLHEIDAASNRGIDDVRALRESVLALPFESEMSVYLVDEAHMLTKEAWNAFLKTLEEPPEHVVFILATTEKEKIPDTILSRCQTFEFKKPSRSLLAKTLMTVAKKEGRTLETPAADLIALLSEGSFRDAYGILQKALVASSEKTPLNRNAIEAVTGAPSEVLIMRFLEALAKGDQAQALSTLGEARSGSTDFSVFTLLFLDTLRTVLLMRVAPKEKEALKETLGEDEYRAFATCAEEKNALSASMLKTFLDAYPTVVRSPLGFLPLELAVLQVLEKGE